MGLMRLGWFWGVRSLLTLTGIFLQGCAASHYMYNHENTLTRKKGDEKAIAVDAKQRFVFARTSDDGLFSSICAEPSPDALSSIVSGVTIGASTGKEALNLALSNAESAANIGLRTQSIQLLRDGMYRICEAAYSGSIEKHEVNALLRRYQDTMIAILAIESLTGAVRANQVILSGKTKATLGNDIEKASELYSNSLSAEKDAKSALDKANESVKEKSGEVEKSQSALDEKLKVLTEVKKADCEDEEKRKNLVDADKTNCDDYLSGKTDLAAKKAEYKELEDAASQAQKKYDIAKEALNTQKNLFDSAITAGSSEATSEGKFAASPSTQTTLSDSSAKHISNAVVKIVDQALLRNDVVDKCLDISVRSITLSQEKERALNETLEASRQKEKIESILESVKDKNSGQKNIKMFEVLKKANDVGISTLDIGEITTALKEVTSEEQNAQDRLELKKESASKVEQIRESLACDDILSAYAKRFSRAYSDDVPDK